MARPAGKKTRCSGQWTEARFNSFIKSLLRRGSQRWAPISETLKEARVSRGVYECADCKSHVPPTVKDGRKRVKNVVVDHIEPIINPETGFTSWDDCIDKMFCEKENLQVLCKECHDIKSMAERKLAAETRKRNKENNE